MSGPKWTPGPWRVVIDDTGGQFSGWPFICAPPEADVTIIHRAGFKQDFWGELSQRETLANARLIAAAPEMYTLIEAFRETAAALLEGDTAEAWVSGCDQILVKARGNP